MGKQISPVVKIKGQIDQLNFFESQDGYMVRKAGKFNKDKYLTAETYDLTRRNASEFGIAGKAARVFRDAWNAQISRAADNRLMSRLLKTMITTLQSDTTGTYGSRRVEDGTLNNLVGFDFNLPLPLRAVARVEPTVALSRATGQVTISLPSYIPRQDIVVADGATHYSFFMAAAVIDFFEGTSYTAQAETAALPWDRTPTVAANLQATLPGASTSPIFVIMGIEFKKIVNGDTFRFSKNEAALQVFAVDTP
jgi:hypothetical protein